MTTAYTSLLGLALPVTGELSGTWGDTVNTAITSLLDTAIAGTTSITVDADITLSTTTGASNQARQAIILWNPASGTVTRNITAPAQSKLYTVINASGGTQSIVIRGAGPTTGVTIAKGESATVAWNGSDFVKVGSSGGAITFTDLTVTGNTILGNADTDTLEVYATSTFLAPVSFQGQVKLPSAGRSAAAALTVTNPAFLYGVASTYVDSTSSGTIAAMAPFYSIARPTLSTNNVTTYTNAATLYIANSPAAGGSATITNPFALYIAAGNTYLGGTLNVNSSATLGGAVTLGTTSANAVTVNGTITSNLIFTDNTYDIGASGATRPRDLFLSRSLTVGGNTTLGDAAADTVTVNGTVTSNLIFTDNTYDIGASGATRPRNLFLAGSATLGAGATSAGNITFQNNANAGQTEKFIVSNAFGGAARFSANGATAGDRSVQLGIINNSGTFTGYLEVGDNYVTVQGLTVGRGGGAVVTNTAVGGSVLTANTTGNLNTSVGYYSMVANTTGNSNTALGYYALAANLGGYANVAVGRGALVANTSGYQNIAIGSQDEISIYGPLRSNLTGAANLAIGNGALQANTSGNYNVALGHQALTSNTTGLNQTAVGYQALYTANNGTNNGGTAVGYRALFNSTGPNNVAVGQGAGQAVTTGDNNTFVGWLSAASGAGLTGSSNSFYGSGSGYVNTSGSSNSFYGTSSGYSNSTGANNVAVGSSALYSNTTASNSTAVGAQALNLSTGAQNTAVGYQAANSNTTGQANTAVGFQVKTGSTASNVTAIGSYIGNDTMTGNNNTLVGQASGVSLTSGQGNTFVGAAGYINQGSGGLITTGSKNTILGPYNGNQGSLDIRTANNYIVLSDGDGNPRGYHNGSAWNSSTGGFISKQGSTYSNSYATVPSWGSNFNTVIPVGTLGRGQTYLVHFIWNYQDGGQPYYLDAVMLFTATNTNGTDGGNQVDLISLTHTGTAGYYYTVRGVAGSFTTSGLQVKLTNVTNDNGILYVYAVQIATGA